MKSHKNPLKTNKAVKHVHHALIIEKPQRPKVFVGGNI